MAGIGIHDGTWRLEDEIDPLSSKDQRLPTRVGMAMGFGLPSMLGLDTEFLIKKSSNQVIWPWDLKFPQEREPDSPKTGDGGGNFDFHGDGYATELCIAPTYCLDLMMEMLGRSIAWVQAKGAKSLEAPALYTIPAEVEKQAPAVAKRLGCMPSLNAYGDSGEPSSLTSTTRTTGCHLHISHPILQNQDIALALVKWADIVAGTTWTYISPNPSRAEAERRKAYGRAGEFRLKQYNADPLGAYSFGVEYRVLPGTPMQHPAYLTLLFSLYRTALRLTFTYGNPVEELALQAKEAINSGNKTEAKAVLTGLPISLRGRKLIRYLRRATLNAGKDLTEWAGLGWSRKGHQALFAKEGIDNRLTRSV